MRKHLKGHGRCRVRRRMSYSKQSGADGVGKQTLVRWPGLRRRFGRYTPGRWSGSVDGFGRLSLFGGAEIRITCNEGSQLKPSIFSKGRPKSGARCRGISFLLHFWNNQINLPPALLPVHPPLSPSVSKSSFFCPLPSFSSSSFSHFPSPSKGSSVLVCSSPFVGFVQIF